MRVVISIGLCFAVLLCVAAAVRCEEEQPSWTTDDPRLSEAQTIRCAEGRLHTALEKLSAVSGVKIYAGKSSKDWRVRGIPVFVCVDRVPLGRLLRNIAESTSLLVTRSKSKDGEFAYTLWRDSKRQKELDGYLEEIEAFKAAQAEQFFDVWSKIKDVPDSAFRDEEMHGSHRHAQYSFALAKAVSQVVSELSPEAKDCVMSGRTLKIVVENTASPTRTVLEDGFRDLWQKHRDAAVEAGYAGPEPMSQEQLSKCCFDIESPGRFDPSMEPGLRIWMQGAVRLTSSVRSFRSTYLKDSEYGPPEPPSYPSPPESVRPPEYARDAAYSTAIKPFLERKVVLKPPENKKAPTYDDALAALSDEIGFSIVAEDFVSRVRLGDSPRTKPKDLFGKESTIAQVVYSVTGISWYPDEKNKALIGKTSSWTIGDRYRNFIPESVVETLHKKLNGPGAGLEDFAPMACLTVEQLREWIWDEEYNLNSKMGYLTWDPLWRLYFKLNPKQRAQARSKAGFPVSALDAGWVAEAIAREGDDSTRVLLPDGRVVPDEERERLLTDPEVLASAVMRVTSEERDGRLMYTVAVKGLQDGKSVEMSREIGPFPVYSVRREAEMREKAVGGGK